MLEGYRVWLLAKAYNPYKGFGIPMLHAAGSHSHGFWQPGVNKAKCHKLMGRIPILRYLHVIPSKTCGCGITALKKIDTSILEGAEPANADGSCYIWGAITLWGRYIETETAYRAEYAKIEALFRPQSSIIYIGLLNPFGERSPLEKVEDGNVLESIARFYQVPLVPLP